MSTATPTKLAKLYRSDETAWLEAMAELIRSGRLDEVDYPNLAEYLSDMAIRDRREVMSRLVVLIMHLLKWQYQPTLRSRSWLGTIIEQRQELEEWVEGGVLRNHAINVLSTAHRKAIRRAVAETGLTESTFPATRPFSLDEVLNGPIDGVSA